MLRSHVLLVLFTGALALTMAAGCGGSESGGGEIDLDTGGGSTTDAGGTTGGGTSDTGVADTGAPDTGAPDTGAPDTGAPDTGAPDTDMADTGDQDTGAPDTDTADTDMADTGDQDTGEDPDVPADPCMPNPCTMPGPATCAEDGVTLLTPAETGECAVDGDDMPVCTYPEEETDCAAQDQICRDGACVDDEPGLPQPAEGEVIVTEIMYDPHFDLNEGEAEWIELYNTTDEALTLTGCELRDSGDGVTIEDLDIPAGGYVVFAQSEDAGLNGGLSPDALFSFSLGNDGDTVSLVCGDVTVNSVAYDDGGDFPDARARSLNLNADNLTAADNGDGANWCPAIEAYYTGAVTPDEDNYGTPGAPNSVCPVPDTTVDWCRLQSPTDAMVPAGTMVTVYGRVYEAGITDLTDLTDVTEALLAEVGFGPDGTDPDGNGDWSWVTATANPGWNALDAGEAGNDEYQATFPAPSEGTYDHAYRFSRDGGATWLYCDSDARGDGGGDGAEDGYQIAAAGNLVVAGSVCDPNPCDAPAAATCSDDNLSRVVEVGPGACEVVDGAPSCTYTEEIFDCTLTGATCSEGVCVGGLEPPAPGDVIISEVMFNALDEDNGEWIELYNTTDQELTLNGCVLGDDDNSDAHLTINGVSVPAGGHALFLKSDDLGLNTNLTGDGVFAFNLSNSGDVVALTCGDVTIDAIDYGAEGWPSDEDGVALQLDQATLNGDANDDGANWCLATEVYHSTDGADSLGSPGALNAPCALPDTVVDFCRLQAPLDAINIQAGSPIIVYGRVYEEGITDLTDLTDPDERLIAEAGFGPDGSEPDGSPDWIWVTAEPNLEYDDTGAFGEDNNDEYLASFPAPPAGTYDHAYRFSRDGGVTWLYCDGQDAGSSDGYQTQNAGNLQTVGSSMARPPVAGEVIINEIMTTPGFGLDAGGAWLELYNRTNETLDLDGCEINDLVGGGQGFLSSPIAFTLDPGGYAVIARSDDPDVNGGLFPDAVIDFFSMRDLNLTCGGTLIDGVSFSSDPPWPMAEEGIAIQLNADDLDASDNDNGANWCPATDIYYSTVTGDNLGSPGSPNVPCPVQMVRAPVEGEVVISEIMFNPGSSGDGLSDNDAEWFEVVNVTGEPLSLSSCEARDSGSGVALIEDLVVPPGGYALFVRSADEAINGGLTPDVVFDFSLGNGGDAVSIVCPNGLIDEVVYDDAYPWTDIPGVAIQLNPERLNAEDNASPLSWCAADTVYATDATGDNFGTPGGDNTACPVLDTTVDFCRLQFPLDATEVEAGAAVTVYGRVYEAGITDQSDLTDADFRLSAQVGFGPDGTDPDGDDAWTWVDAEPNPEYDDTGAFGEDNNDEYLASFTAPPEGTYDHAYRFSLDGGLSWLYCDGQDAGSSDGYQIENAGNLQTVGDGLSEGVLLLTELADPNNEAGARYVELYNPTDQALDLVGWSLQRWTNANVDPQSPVDLVGVVPARGFFIVCANADTFNATFAGVTCDLDIGTGGAADSNGDDNLAILKDGVVFDLFGVPGEDGSNTPHEFEDGRAERGCDNSAPATTWAAAGWVIDNDSGGGDGAQDAPDGFDPGVWSCVLE